MIFKPQSNRSSLYVNNVTLRSNRSLTAAWTATWTATWTANLTAAAFILTMVTLRKPLPFEPQQSVYAITFYMDHGTVSNSLKWGKGEVNENSITRKVVLQVTSIFGLVIVCYEIVSCWQIWKGNFVVLYRMTLHLERSVINKGLATLLFGLFRSSLGIDTGDWC